IGDVWQISEVRLEVSQPRQPCWKLGRRWNRADLPKKVVQTGMSGWYLRVLTEGMASPGELVLSERPNPGWTISRCNELYYGHGHDSHETLQELANLPQLSEAWKEDLTRKLAPQST
ncbi:MAG: MOSC domain-containing protein, partial [Planctomycetaceae bacterium]|nr:MOSC domain-containing protein [Planctomycetaceae bacterium]